MHLQVPPDAPLWMHIGADALLVSHIGGGAVGLVSGAVAVVARKGGRLHARAGTVFFISMLFMCVIGAVVAPFLSDRVSTVAGVFTFYLLLTAWVTVKRKRGEIGVFERTIFVLPFAVASAGFLFMYMGAHDPSGTVDGQPTQAFYVYAIVGSVAGLSDIKVILQRGISGVGRVARHLWRMCFALFVASGSLFLGQMQFFPKAFADSAGPYVLAFLPILILLGWMIAVRFMKKFKGPAYRARPVEQIEASA